MNKGLTPVEEIRKRILQSYDRNVYEQQYGLLLRVNGLDVREGLNTSHDDYGDGILRFDDIVSDTLKAPGSNLIQNTVINSFARRFAKPIEPNYIGIDDVDREVRKAVFAYNYEGSDAMSMGFRDDTQWAFVSGDLLGIGCLQFGLSTDFSTKTQRVVAQHIPRLNLGYDPFANSPNRARYVWVAHYLSVDQVVAMYGTKVADRAYSAMQTHGGYQTKEIIEHLRVIEYFDIGFGRGRPTYAVFVGSIDQYPPIKLMELPSGGLPFAWMTGFSQPMQRFPSGRAERELSNNLGINAIESAIAEILDMPALDIIDSSAEKKIIKALENGDRRVVASMSGKDGAKSIFQRIPSPEIPESYMAFRQMLYNASSDDSNSGDFDRNKISPSARPATEIMIMNERNLANQAFSIQQTLKFQKMIVEAHDNTIVSGDFFPRNINIRGRQIRVNDPEIPESLLSNFYMDEAVILIDEASVTAQEDLLRNAARQQALKSMLELNPNLFKPRWVGEELLKTYDASLDPDVALVDEGGGAPGSNLDPAAMMAALGGNLPEAGGGAAQTQPMIAS